MTSISFSASVQLSIYSPDVATVPFVEEPPGVVQTGLGAVRTGLQPYARALQV